VINRSIKPATDLATWGHDEWWEYPARQGDCDDVMRAKRRALIGKGWPVGALLMTVVRQPDGEGHAILTVLTDRGDFILDNLDDAVELWSAASYRFVKRQSEYDSGAWVAIDDGHQQLVGSIGR